ncbi:MAG: hypothetical protein CMP59_13300 [Flavobacteriales bacterium]|nr:hypothetical protein [Flavobacteriales bacterium]
MKTIVSKLLLLKTVTFSMFFLTACNLESQEQSADQEQSVYQKVSPSAFKAQMNEEKSEYLLVDVRTAGEYEAGAISNSENHDLLNGDFEKAMANWDPKTPIYVYCAKGGRSSQAAEMLQQQGFKKIIELKGGYSSWSMRTN